MRYKKLNEISLSDKSVLLRLDLNTPIDAGAVTNQERIIRSLPTVNFILESGARLIIMSHLGRPKGNGYEKNYSLKNILKYLSSKLNKDVLLIDQYFYARY